ncbi:MAG: nucleotidyltransferase domain-containing protein [Peptococcaceae bacterium]|jgi:predicted nucleotidyltransferase|nr:nucleotidyltransferase domain-containing protein [Peptococcaceae bacterium]
MTNIDDGFTISEEVRHTLPPERKKAVIRNLTGFILNHAEILFSYLHGSFLENSSFRDVDVAVYFDRTVPAERRLDLCLDLAVALSRLAGFPVDVQALNEASPGFRYHATRGLVLSSRDEEKRYDFLERTWMTYFDYQPVLRQIRADLLAGLDTSPAKQPAGKDRSRETA